tara:strand:- start:1794 stop:1979 length:186 start_codon:yes stop_codon:yes gene_type:complete
MVIPIHLTHPRNYLALNEPQPPHTTPLKMRLVFDPLLLLKGAPPKVSWKKGGRLKKWNAFI